MRVKELIEKLKQCDPEAVVAVANFDYGFDEIRDIVSLDGTTVNSGDADYVPADGDLPRVKTKIVCIGPKDPSAVARTYDMR